MDPRARTRTSLVLAALVVLAVTTGCSAGGSGASSAVGSPSGAAASFDPPVRFDPASAVSVEAPGSAVSTEASAGTAPSTDEDARPVPVAAHGTLAFFASANTVLAVEAGTSRISQLRPAQGSTGQGSTSASSIRPFLAHGPDAPELYVPFGVWVRPTASAPGHHAMELVAVDPQRLERRWSTTVALPAWTADVTSVRIAVVGVTADLVIVTVAPPTGLRTTSTLAVGRATHQVVWTRDGAAAQVVTGAQVVAVRVGGAETVQLVGLAAADGRETWQRPEAFSSLVVTAAGDGTVAVAGDHELRAFSALLDGGTGTTRRDLTALFNAGRPPSESVRTATCQDDGTGTVVCWADEQAGCARQVIAVDVASATVLWAVPASGAASGAAPKVSTVWHGAVYAATDTGPVVLDARTGAVREPAPGVVPVLVSGSLAVVDPVVVDGGPRRPPQVVRAVG